VYLTADDVGGPEIYDGAVAAASPPIDAWASTDVVIPVVAECDDRWLNDARVVQVQAARGRAIAAAARGFARGASGAADGMVCFGSRAGSGTVQQRDRESRAVGALVRANFGARISCASTACRPGG